MDKNPQIATEGNTFSLPYVISELKERSRITQKLTIEIFFAFGLGAGLVKVTVLDDGEVL